MEDNSVITQGRQTIEMAIQGLQSVASSLDENFVNSVDLIIKMRGRLIVTGMGKSGHIARKIAATFASTGTPAHFVHPSEANHGDMGMISQGDVVIMLSNSGETAELNEMTSYAKRFNIPLIALVRREKSTLVEIADIAIILQTVPEASPIGAPTTSTTMMLAYGDALAMAVLHQKGFTKDDFSILHPGGKLGKDLIRVKQLMHYGSELPLVKANDLMKEVLMVMTRNALGCAIIADDENNLLGVVTDGDLRRHIDNDIMSLKAYDIMTATPKTIHQDMLAVEALNILNSKAITCLLVTENQKIIGLLHIHDCLRAGIV